MAISQAQKIDLLFKQAFGVTKTDLETNKSPSNESIVSPPIIRADSIWTKSSLIPTNGASAVAGIVSDHTGVQIVKCEPDITTVQINGIYPTWKTNLKDWIPTEFHSTYLVKVYVDDSNSTTPGTTGTQIFAAGSNDTGEYFFNYSSGVLNFIGGTIPSVLTSGKSIFISGFRYIGTKGIPSTSNMGIGYEHVQTLPSVEWEIQHNLNSTRAMVTVYDDNMLQIIPDEIKIINTNEILVSLSAGVTGRAMVIAF